jgi:hypothetical protein
MAMNPLPRPAAFLSIAALACAAAASVATLAWSGAFPEVSTTPALNGVLAEARGWSLVTLGLVAPLLALSLVAARRGSLRGRLAWLGTVAYLVYTYLEFAVSPPFTALYLVYVTAFACAIPALVMGAASVDVQALPFLFDDRTPRRTVAVFSLVFAGLLTAAWLRGIVEQTAKGDFGWPVGEAAIGHVVHALDLGLQVPLAVASGILLLRRRPAGYLVGAIMMINAVCMSAALTAMVAWRSIATAGSALQGVPFAVTWLAAVVLAGAFLRAAGRGAKRQSGSGLGREPS